MIISLILGLLLGASVLIFTFQNMITVSVFFLTWQFSGSLALILVLAVVAGMLLSSLFMIPYRIKNRFQISELQTETVELKEEISKKEDEIDAEKGKLAATNAYIDDRENNPQ